MENETINQQGAPENSQATPTEEKPKTAIEQAQEILGKITQANTETLAIVERAEALKSENMLSGTSDAGSAPVAPDKEQIVTDRVNKMLENTGLKI